MQLGRLVVLVRDPRRAVLGAEGHQLCVPIVPELVTPLPGPLEPDLVQKIDARLGHVVRLALVEELVLMLLRPDPGAELPALVVAHRHVEVSVLFLVSFELFVTVQPLRRDDRLRHGHQPNDRVRQEWRIPLQIQTLVPRLLPVVRQSPPQIAHFRTVSAGHAHLSVRHLVSGIGHGCVDGHVGGGDLGLLVGSILRRGDREVIVMVIVDGQIGQCHGVEDVVVDAAVGVSLPVLQTSCILR
mmetsp:Transcript_38253/g.81649  ORF Transcript_38253/g.81649 Transcript_38253/m.81649 type:complete len:242 (+) Transcript_38253:2237-2962(+)